MKRYKWFLLVIGQELVMLKFKAILRYLYDSNYRKDINLLSQLLSGGKLSAQLEYLSLDQIDFSHDVTYPLWVMSLIRQLSQGKEFQPIKVILNPQTNKYMVIDGNHRLMAYYLTYSSRAVIQVRVLRKRPFLYQTSQNG